MDLKSLSDRELIEKTKADVEGERGATLNVLYSFIEIEERKLYAAQASSMFEWAVSELKMSNGHAQRRVDGARLLRKFPEIAGPLQNGRLNLSLLSLAQSHFRFEQKAGRPVAIVAQLQLLQELEGKSTREAERHLGAGKACTRGLRLKPNDEQMEIFKRVRDLWGHRFPGGDWTTLFAAMAELTLEQIDPDRKLERSEKRRARKAAKASAGAGSENGRQRVHDRPERQATSSESDGPGVDVLDTGEVQFRLPIEAETATASNNVSAADVGAKRPRRPSAETRRLVWQRDGGQCAYIGPDGRRCTSTHALEFDHRVPFAWGGENSIDNIRLVCRVHNAYLAAEAFGREFMGKFSKQHEVRVPQAPASKV